MSGAEIAEGPGWRLIRGDCLDPVTGLASLADKSVDHILTDPPYGVDAHTKGRRIANPRTGEIRVQPVSFDSLTADVLQGCAAQFGRLATRWILAFCQIEQLPAWRSAYLAHGARDIRAMVWVKPNGQPQLTGDRPGVGYECIAVGHGPDIRLRWNGGGKRGWLMHCVDANFSRTPRVHETQKPEPLMVELVRDFTDPGELVCDPFAGSGTTGVACIRLGRRFVGWEKDPRYHAIAVKRLRAAREQLRMFESGGLVEAQRAGGEG